jgi:tetratricopeptide (TPR) repeat protein
LELTRQQPEDLSHRQLLGRAYLNLGTVIRTPKRAGEAQQAYEHAMSLLRPLSESHPEKPDYRHELAVALNNLGNLLSSTERFEDARKMHALAKSHFAALATDFPNVPIYRQELANSSNSHGAVAFHLKDYQGAISDCSEAATLLVRLLEKRPGMVAYQGDLGMVLFNLGLAQHAVGNFAQAREHLEQSIKRLKNVTAKSGKRTMHHDALQDSYQNLAEVLIVSGDHVAAAEAARGLAGASELPMHHYYSACFFARCVPLAEGDQTLDAEQRRELREQYADQSVAALSAAREKGFAEVERIRADQATIMASVTARPAFQELVQRVGDKRDSSSR